MATSKRKRVRFTLDVNFTTEAEKDAFGAQLSAVRDRLTPRGSPMLNNHDLLLALFDLASNKPSSSESQQYPSSGSFLRNAGQFQFARYGMCMTKDVNNRNCH